ncbi:MAG: STAS domain-containing protein [Planctomycetota bacterium]
MRSHKSESPPVPEKHPSESTRAVDAVGNLCDTRVLDVFHRRCVQAMNPERRTVVVDLARVTSVDTKLIATLITLLKQARAAGKSLDLTVSDRVYDWIRLCQVERLLCPKRARRHAATQIRKPRHARVSRCRHPKRLSRPASRRPATMGNHVAI